MSRASRNARDHGTRVRARSNAFHGERALVAQPDSTAHAFTAACQCSHARKAGHVIGAPAGVGSSPAQTSMHGPIIISTGIGPAAAARPPLGPRAARRRLVISDGPTKSGEALGRQPKALRSVAQLLGLPRGRIPGVDGLLVDDDQSHDASGGLIPHHRLRARPQLLPTRPLGQRPRTTLRHRRAGQVTPGRRQDRERGTGSTRRRAPRSTVRLTGVTAWSGHDHSLSLCDGPVRASDGPQGEVCWVQLLTRDR